MTKRVTRRCDKESSPTVESFDCTTELRKSLPIVIELWGTPQEFQARYVLELKAFLEKTRGNLGVATELHRQLTAQHPDNLAFRLDLGECLATRRLHNEALEEYKQVRNLVKQQNRRNWAEEWAYRNSGLILRSQGRYQQAV